MGYLHYGEAASFAFDNRLLTHLRTVILGKFILRESLPFTWSDGETQHSLWLHPSAPLRFEFDVGTTPKINPAWIERLMASADSAGGLRLIEEPAEESRGESRGSSTRASSASR